MADFGKLKTKKLTLAKQFEVSETTKQQLEKYKSDTKAIDRKLETKERDIAYEKYSKTQ